MPTAESSGPITQPTTSDGGIVVPHVTGPVRVGFGFWSGKLMVEVAGQRVRNTGRRTALLPTVGGGNVEGTVKLGRMFGAFPKVEVAGVTYSDSVTAPLFVRVYFFAPFLVCALASPFLSSLASGIMIGAAGAGAFVNAAVVRMRESTPVTLALMTAVLVGSLTVGLALSVLAVLVGLG